MPNERPPMRGTDIRLHLCPDHRNNRYKFEDGRCGKCGYWTCSPAFKLCSECARLFGRCQVCMQEMETPGPDTDWTYDDVELVPEKTKQRLTPKKQMSLY